MQRSPSADLTRHASTRSAIHSPIVAVTCNAIASRGQHRCPAEPPRRSARRRRCSVREIALAHVRGRGKGSASAGIPAPWRRRHEGGGCMSGEVGAQCCVRREGHLDAGRTVARTRGMVERQHQFVGHAVRRAGGKRRAVRLAHKPPAGARREPAPMLRWRHAVRAPVRQRCGRSRRRVGRRGCGWRRSPRRCRRRAATTRRCAARWQDRRAGPRGRRRPPPRRDRRTAAAAAGRRCAHRPQPARLPGAAPRATRPAHRGRTGRRVRCRRTAPMRPHGRQRAQHRAVREVWTSTVEVERWSRRSLRDRMERTMRLVGTLTPASARPRSAIRGRRDATARVPALGFRPGGHGR